MGEKYSPWFPPEVKPVHVGMYESTIFEPNEWTMFLHRFKWDGKLWTRADGKILAIQLRYWRGLASPSAKEPK